MIETRLLHYFLAVAKEQSITKAAEALHLSQPTLSKQLMELERQMGTQLLIRGKKNVTLTEDGRYLQNCANKIMLLMDQTTAALTAGRDSITGDIHVGCAESPVMAQVAKVFREFQEEYPRTRLHVYAEGGNPIMERLDSGLLDIALFTGPVIHEKYDYWTLPIRDHWGLLMPENCPLAKKESITAEDLYRLPIILPSRIYNSPWAPAEFTIDRALLQVVATYNMIGSALHLVMQGVGYGFCLAELVQDMKIPGLTFRSLEPRIYVNLSIVTKKNATLSPAAKMFLKRLQEELQ